MTTIKFSWKQADGQDATGMVSFTPYRRTVEGNSIIVDQTMTYKVDGYDYFELPATEVDNAYRVSLKPVHATAWEEYVSVPDVDEIEYVDLPKVDPLSLPPAN